MRLDRCYVCHRKVTLADSLVFQGVEPFDVAICESCTELAFGVLGMSPSSDHCIGCGVERPSMN